VLILRGKKDAALEVGRRAMAKAPSHVESYLAVASLDPSSAGDVLGKAATIAPRDPRVHSALARHHLTLGDAESAMAAAHKALTVDPLGAEARRWALYASAMSSGTLDASGFEQADRARMQGSVDLWAPLLASYPDCALLWVERSATHASLGQVYSAKKDVQHALELDADNVEAHAALGLLLLNDDPVAARPHLQKAADGRPIDASLQVATAMAEAQSGDMAGARRRLKSTVDTHPYDIRALLTYGQVLSAEDPQATYALMADAVQRMPDTRVVLALIGAAKDAGRLPDAAKRLEELAASTGNPAFTEAASVVRGAKP
jgi:tetratricopeptide (TPR) repeat protein